MTDVVRDHLVSSGHPDDKERAARLYDAYVENFKVGAGVCNIDREPSDAVNPNGDNYVAIMRAAGFAFVRSMIEYEKIVISANIERMAAPSIFTRFVHTLRRKLP